MILIRYTLTQSNKIFMTETPARGQRDHFFNSLSSSDIKYKSKERNNTWEICP